MRPSLQILLPLLASCGLLDAGQEPVIEAHRGAAGYWVQNSRTAVLGSIAAGLDGLEIDLVLTADAVPVLSHDPWLHEEICGTADGERLDERLDIMDLDLDELLEGYTCGAWGDPEHPDALAVPEPVMTLDELLEAMAGADPDMVLHLDVKYEPGHTPRPEEFAEEVLGRVADADLPNPWYVSANMEEVLQAFKDHGEGVGMEVPTSLIWPRFPPDGSDTAVALSWELASQTGVRDLVALARRARADGLALPYQVIDWGQVEAARAEGLTIQVWTVNDHRLMERFQRWPVDTIITDYPLEAP